MKFIQLITIESSPLALDGWLSWNKEMWGLEPRRVVYTPKGKDLPRLEGVLYLNRKGRVQMPPRNPYLPVRFVSTDTERPERLYRQWLDVCTPLAEELARRGIHGTITLPPGMIDGRPFQWRGMEVGVRYTFMTYLPVNEQYFDASVRKNMKKASKAGYKVERTRDWDAILRCLEETEEAKGFSHQTDFNALVKCHELLGDESFRGYIGYNKEGNVVSGGIRLHLQGGTSVDWSQGTVRSELKSGINQLLYMEVLKDLAEAGAVAFDYVGANIPPVAAAKATWGFPLVPYLTIRTPDIRHLARVTFQVGKRLFNRPAKSAKSHRSLTFLMVLMISSLLIII